MYTHTPYIQRHMHVPIYIYTCMCPHSYMHTYMHMLPYTHTHESHTNTKDKMGIIYIKTKETFKWLIHLRTFSTNYFLLSFCGGLQKTFMHSNGLGKAQLQTWSDPANIWHEPVHLGFWDRLHNSLSNFCFPFLFLRGYKAMIGNIYISKARI